MIPDAVVAWQREVLRPTSSRELPDRAPAGRCGRGFRRIACLTGTRLLLVQRPPQRSGHGMKRILVVFGTRPEVIKLAPVVRALRERNGVSVTLCSTGQHRRMLDDALDAMELRPDIDLAVMQTAQHPTAARDCPGSCAGR